MMMLPRGCGLHDAVMTQAAGTEVEGRLSEIAESR